VRVRIAGLLLAARGCRPEALAEQDHASEICNLENSAVPKVSNKVGTRQWGVLIVSNPRHARHGAGSEACEGA
jgi:hypothetical protein